MRKIKLESKVLIMLFFLFLLSAVTTYQSNRVIYGGEFELKLMTFVIIFLIYLFLFFRFKWFTNEYFYLRIVMIGITSYTSLMLLMVIFNFINLNTTNNEMVRSIECEVTGVAKRRMSRGFYYKFMGNQKFMRGFENSLIDIEDSGIENCVVKINYKKGMFKTYLISSYEVLCL